VRKALRTTPGRRAKSAESGPFREFPVMAHPLLFSWVMMNTTFATEPTPARAKTLAPDAFGCLYETHYGLVYRVCYRYTKNPEESADLAHEVFLKVHGNFSTFEGNSQTSTWLYRVASNHCLDHLRWKKRQADLMVGYGEDLVINRVPEAAPDNPARRLFRRLLEGLDAANRQVVFLRFEVGLTHEEIAEICGVSRVAITKRLAKFQAKVVLLKSELSDALDSLECDAGRRVATFDDYED
jgi:RNA polymerase sigma factor (sigma-70 family)